MFSDFNFLHTSIKNSACRSGSPPEKVTPPPECLKNTLAFIIFSASLSESISLPEFILQVSGLWQNLHLKLHPCINTTYRIPGPSTVLKLSIECIFPIIISPTIYCGMF
ncbi:hypothetical protein D3C73_1206540 [compost metagenome]